MKYKFLIIGYFGFVDNQIDGQTIKTRNINELISNNYQDSDILIFDTQVLKANKFLIFDLLFKLLKSNQIILVPGLNNLNKFFKFLSLICTLLQKKIVLFAVGGWLPDFVRKNLNLKREFNKLSAIFVESNSMKVKMNSLDLDNVIVFPNFRNHCFVPDLELKSVTGKFKIIFCARICKEKGYDYIFELNDYFLNNKSLFDKSLVIDFYGPIDIKDELDFRKKLNIYSNINYNGVIAPQDVFDVISSYDLNILPSFYEGEGFPGTIIDSFIAAVPVIVSNWKDLPEFVKHGYNGYVFNLDCKDDLFELVKGVVNDDALLYEFKVNSHVSSKEYSSIHAINILKKIYK